MSAMPSLNSIFFKKLLRFGLLSGVIATNSAYGALSTCGSGSGLDCFEISTDNSESFVEQALSDSLAQSIDVALYGNSTVDASLFTFTYDGGGGGGELPGPDTLAGSQNGTWAVLDSTTIDYISILAENLSTSTVSIYDVGNSSSGLFSLDALNFDLENKYSVVEINFWTRVASIDEPAPLLLILLSAAIVILRRCSTQYTPLHSHK